MLTLNDFKAARSVLSGVLLDTHLVYSAAFSKATGNQVYFKPENMQATGAYKIRGACYKISTLSEEEKARGLVTASAGNHAQGVAYAAQHAGVPATIVMPTTTPLVKVNNTKDLGAKVVLHGEKRTGHQKQGKAALRAAPARRRTNRRQRKNQTTRYRSP